MPFTSKILGRTGLTVSPLGLSTGGGALPARAVERAFERGLTYFYFGSYRAPTFAEGVRALVKQHREQLTLALQSYTRSAMLMAGSLASALKKPTVEHRH